MTRREIVQEVIGSICFMVFLFMLVMACYVAAPYQPGPDNEAVIAEAGQ